jgi:hypothetical protein
VKAEDDDSDNSIAEAIPLIEKVIPTEGPLYVLLPITLTFRSTGGIEVTVLGSEFSAKNRVLFGETEAIATNFWGPKTLLCILPPSMVPCTIPVTIKDVDNDAQTPIMFTYKDGIYKTNIC